MVAHSNPPRNGEGDRREAVVEGSLTGLCLVSRDYPAEPAPSVSPADCHLPVPGRI